MLDITVGDTVERLMGGKVAMDLRVTKIDTELIYCGPWTFSRNNGAEIDPELGWDEKGTGSYIRKKADAVPDSA